MVAGLPTQIYDQVREIVFLLMQRPITEEIATQVEAIDGFEHLEILDGAWVGFDKDEFMGGEEHGWIESILIHALMEWVLARKSGRVYSGDTDFVLDGTPDDIRISRRPDVAYVSDRRLQPSKGFVYGAPDLAVEIISPSERPAAIRRKLNIYLEHGVQQVWQVYPDNRQIVVNFHDGSAKTYGLNDTMSGGDLLPGFTLNVAKVFEA
jgi:Uma2 family endonuclease